MRTTAATAALVLVLVMAALSGLTGLTGGTATAAEPGGADSPPLPEPASPQAVLATAEEVVAGETSGAPDRESDGPTTPGPSATLALRDLRAVLPALRGTDARRAESLLARPTDGADDRYGDGYAVRSRRDCGRTVCVHWVRRTADAPPSRAWVRRTKRTVNRMLRHQVREMGYRKPLGDGRRGGDRKLDVYLADVGSRGYYGYCAPERRSRRHPRTASGFCVLDNDFAEFGGKPAEVMRVTAAHELFHAVQFAHDHLEDGWLMESTATWIEERLADAVDDNRQYLSSGQLGDTRTPLDLFGSYHPGQYGNWIFWEHLSGRHGADVVRRVWERAAAYRGGPDDYSVQAVRRVLRSRGGFAESYARFASGNLTPERTYPEGAAYSDPRSTVTRSVGPSSRRGGLGRRLRHLTSVSLRLRPGDRLDGRRWRLRLVVDAPDRRTGPAAHLVVTRQDGRSRSRPVRLGRGGGARTVVAFGPDEVASVAVTLANASTRYRCRRGTSFACQGASRDDGRRYRVRYRAFRR
jgi:hypothetical protein